MRLNRKIFLIVVILFVWYSETEAQNRTMKKIEGFIIPEIGAVIDLQKDNLKCLAVLPKDNSSDKGQDVDIKEGDLILYINGERVKTIEQLKKKYESCEVGSEVKLGIKRAESDNFIASFKRADKKELSKVKMQTITMDGPGNNTDGGIKNKVVKFKDGKMIVNGKEVNVDSLKKSGKNIIIRKSSEKKDD